MKAQTQTPEPKLKPQPATQKSFLLQYSFAMNKKKSTGVFLQLQVSFNFMRRRSKEVPTLQHLPFFRLFALWTFDSLALEVAAIGIAGS